MFAKFKTLEQIQATFTEAVSDLQNLQQRNGDVVDKNVAQIERLRQHNEELIAENARASRFQQNLENILS